jgi:KDO2-lipid IV(A) lauroyltransferase
MYGLLRFLLWYVSLGSLRRLERMARAWGWVLSCVLRVRHGVVAEALERSFPDWTPAQREAVYREMWFHQAMNTLEVFRFCGPKGEEEFADRFIVPEDGRERVVQARAGGKGVLILIAHIGNYDLLGMATPTLFRFPLYVISKALRNKGLNRFWQEHRERMGVKIILAHQAYRPAVRALKENALVGFMLDQNRPGHEGVFVPFFGKTASTTPGLAFMSAHTKAPVVPIFIRREPDGRHRLDIGAVIEPPPDRKEETLLAYTARYTKIIEDAVREAPAQWLWLHKRWKTRPASSAS